MGVQSHLALCCKATLPILCMGHVRVKTDHHLYERRLRRATRCLTKQPGGVSHLEVTWWGIDVNYGDWVGTRHLIDLRCALLLHACPMCAVTRMSWPLLLPWHSHGGTQTGPDAMLLCASAACSQTCASSPCTACMFPCQHCSWLPRSCMCSPCPGAAYMAVQPASSPRDGLP